MVELSKVVLWKALLSKVVLTKVVLTEVVITKVVIVYFLTIGYGPDHFYRWNKASGLIHFVPDD